MLEDVGHRYDIVNTSAVGEYAMKQADMVESMLTGG